MGTLSNRIFLCLAVTVTLGAAPLNAAEQRKSYSFNVLSGKPHRVDTYLRWNDNCVGALVVAKALQRPKHGTAKSKTERTTIKTANSGSAKNCRGKKIVGTSIYYTSKPGYRGRDSFSMSDGSTVYTYNMLVH